MEFKGVVPHVEKSPQKERVSSGGNGRWSFPEEMGKGVGFIYAVFDTVLNRVYFGKKLYKMGGTKSYGKESDWKTYLTSSKTMKDVWKTRPLEEFEFICLEQYNTKGTLSYAETWTLCKVEAPTTVLIYNKRIEAVSWKVKEPISKRHIKRLDSLMGRVNGKNS